MGTHKKHKCEQTLSVTIYCNFFISCILSCFSLLCFLSFSARVIPFPLRAPSFYLSFPAFSPNLFLNSLVVFCFLFVLCCLSSSSTSFIHVTRCSLLLASSTSYFLYSNHLLGACELPSVCQVGSHHASSFEHCLSATTLL